jgi:hypothetical protein
MEATASGIAFVPLCTARTCLERPFGAVPATIRAFAPRDGYFSRLVVTYDYFGRTVTERTRVFRHTDDVGSYWSYAVESPRHRRCGTVALSRRQLGRPARGRVFVDPDYGTCAEAMPVARRGVSRVVGIGTRQPAPRGWECLGGFRPNVDNPRPTMLLCYRTGRAGVFARSIHGVWQVGVRHLIR